jgi:hypothetical protein
MDLEDLRLSIYLGFAGTGRPPAPADLAAEHGVPLATVEDGLTALAEARHLVLDSGRIVMAHPFSAIPLGFAVMGRQTLWWGGCAWDSFALPHLLGEEVLVATRCPACSRPLAFNVGTRRPPPGGQVAHFLVPAARMWDDVVHTCRNQRLFCSPRCVGDRPGYVMDLGTLWRLAAHWYDGRLARGYTRRDPPAAKDYLREAGLSGAFWGL